VDEGALDGGTRLAAGLYVLEGRLLPSGLLDVTAFSNSSAGIAETRGTSSIGLLVRFSNSLGIAEAVFVAPGRWSNPASWQSGQRPYVGVTSTTSSSLR
jgi:hypothetical protein